MWVILKVKATRHPCYNADNFLHSDRRWSEGELSTSVGGKYTKKPFDSVPQGHRECNIMLNTVRQHSCSITQGSYIGYMFRLLISHL